MYRTLFISDVHLGTPDSKAAPLMELLRFADAERIYLVGDILDMWELRRRFFWPQAHNDLIQKLLRKVRKGTEIVFIPGNHDSYARQFCGLSFGGIKIMREAVHITRDGKRWLITHGDEFDGAIACAVWLQTLGSGLYQGLLYLNRHLNACRGWLGMDYWSLAGALKQKTKAAVKYVGRYEEALVEKARRMNVHGVICGHIHKAELKTIEDIVYANCGDWVESCTAIVEHHDGTLELLQRSSQSVSTEDAEDVEENEAPESFPVPVWLEEEAALAVNRVEGKSVAAVAAMSRFQP